MTTQTALAKIPTYDFTSPKLYNAVYVPLFQNKTRFLHLFGSAGSGKSAFGFQKEIVLSYRPERRTRKTMVVRQTYNTLKDSCYSDLKTIIHDWSLSDDFEILKSPLSITNKKSNVEFIFRGLDDVEKIKSVKGVDRIIIEEATEIDRMESLDQLSLRLRGFSEVQITLMYNPVNVFHWLNTEIQQKNLTDHFIKKTTYKDNRFLDSAYREYMESLRFRNPNYYKVYVLGEWGQNLEGLIYPDYETVREMPEQARYYGLDFGFNDPTAMVAIATQDNFESLKKDLFIEELIYESHLTSDALIRRMNEIGIDKRTLITADSARPEMIEDIRRAGFNIKACHKYKGSVLDGINAVKNFNIKIVAGGKNLFKEITNYSWREKDGRFRDDEPIDAVNHILDATRYAVEAANQPVFAVSDELKNLMSRI